ncbi:inorganic phosphate transporter [Acidisoma silvae]|uniref:Phosphate transporter n=1 Tax=Acidisoma silvae TaxID=2802396 RepID=A0A964DXU0_9PROT|nr:inorganic phosphate transporter [Acidisoma silvae]MCB8874412.1 inorganic phosphate transporter [Acidisoma silvae]
MSDMTASSQNAGRPSLQGKGHWATVPVFALLLVCGLGYAVYGLVADMESAGAQPLAIGAFLLLGIALLIALGFEFVNGFHDTANAVATVIYTHSLPPTIAVVWSGFFNFLGVLTSTGAVAYAIVALLPNDLVLNVGSGAGFAMIFALLLSAIGWNLLTWWFGIPNSSSHALIGSVIGVGIANQLMAPAGHPTAGVQWGAAIGVLKGLLFSPVAGFVLAALLLLLMKVLIRSKKLYTAPEGRNPPPWWIRGILILTCTSVSFAHGGNDGQKGMGLIMLILIGVAPTAFALNRTVPESHTPTFVAASTHAAAVFDAHAAKDAAKVEAAEARQRVDDAINQKTLSAPETFAALSVLTHKISDEVRSYGALSHVPAAEAANIRNDMYLTDAAVTALTKNPGSVSADEAKTLKSYKTELERGTRFIPTWVKVSVAVALGLGTMVGWKRIVQTVGERIGKTHLTYAQGAASEIVAAATISMAEVWGLPVSTTHILSSGVAGTMVASGSGLQRSTLVKLASAWIMTLPVAIVLSGVLFFVFREIF